MHNVALLCSVAHYVLFSQLNHQIADGDLAPIRQSYVTASSLVLATLFRAALLGGVGICFAQMLWRLLRDQSFRVSTIENLFQMRSNPLKLASNQVMRKGTLLFLVAVYMWMDPVAVTFPPGALTISTRPSPYYRVRQHVSDKSSSARRL
jgi:hypothetical protein